MNDVLSYPTDDRVAWSIWIGLECVVTFVIIVQIVHYQFPIHIVAFDDGQKNVFVVLKEIKIMSSTCDRKEHDCDKVGRDIPQED